MPARRRGPCRKLVSSGHLRPSTSLGSFYHKSARTSGCMMRNAPPAEHHFEQLISMQQGQGSCLKRREHPAQHKLGEFYHRSAHMLDCTKRVRTRRYLEQLASYAGEQRNSHQKHQALKQTKCQFDGWQAHRYSCSQCWRLLPFYVVLLLLL